MPHSGVIRTCRRTPKLASNDNRRCYKVAEGDIIRVEKLGVEKDASVSFDQVLAVNNGELKVGNPTIAGASVTATVLEEGKNRKVIVYKYKRKTGYHKKNGHRQAYTKVKIDKINA